MESGYGRVCWGRWGGGKGSAGGVLMIVEGIVVYDIDV